MPNSKFEQEAQDTGWVGNTGRGVASFLDIDLNAVMLSIEDVADKTRLEWQDLMYRLDSPQGVFHVGEFAPSGDLTCTQCSKTIHLHVAHELQCCVKCNNPEFIFQDDVLH